MLQGLPEVHLPHIRVAPIHQANRNPSDIFVYSITANIVHEVRMAGIEWWQHYIIFLIFRQSVGMAGQQEGIGGRVPREVIEDNVEVSGDLQRVSISGVIFDIKFSICRQHKQQIA